MPGAAYDRRLTIAHVAVIVCGAAILLANAFQTSVWYDETYSVAIAWHPFDEIWRIGGADVHPVLYYLALHVIYLIFGTNIIAYRIFSVIGSIVLSLLGLTHVRRDAGQKTAIVYSLFAYFLPWSVRIAFQVRMYSWLAVAFMLVAIYAWRIVKSAKESAGKSSAPIRAHWWIVMFVCSLACAYLHYYGAVAAFVTQAVVIVSLVKYRAGGRAIAIWAACAVVAVVCYLPWLRVAAAQASVVSNGDYWIKFAYSGTTAELIMFPFNAPELEHVTMRVFMAAALVITLTTVTTGLCIASVYSYGKARGAEGPREDAKGKRGLLLRSPATFALTIAGLTTFVAMLVSMLLGNAFLYYRYLTVFIGPLAMAMAYVFTRTADKRVGYVTIALCLACGGVAYFGAFESSHSQDNAIALQKYEDMCEQARELNGGKEPLVIGDDVYANAIPAVSNVGCDIVYIPEWENSAYEAYEPRFIRGKTYEDVLGGYKGALLLLCNEETAEKVASEFGGTLLTHDYAFHEYSGRFFEYSILMFE